MSTAHDARLAAGRACLAAALDYLSRGFSVVCCCDPDHIGVGKRHGKECDSPGKAPVHLWKEFQTRLPTPDEVSGWWRGYPIGNVGVVLGQVSGVVRVDVDGSEGEARLEQWSGGDLPRTWSFCSSDDGRGLLYRWPHDLPCKSTAKPSPGDHKELRLMGNGSQTVLPPSRHPSGSVYAWEPGLSPDDIELALAPAWLIDRLTPAPRRATPQKDAEASTQEAPDQARVTATLARISPEAYDVWLKVGMGLHATGATWARAAWDMWSKQSDKFDEARQDKAWRSFHTERDSKVTWGTVVHLAHEAAARAVPDMTCQAAPPQPDEGDAADLLKRADHDAAQRRNGQASLVASDDAHLPLSDYTNAVALVRDHGHNLRYCYPWKAWLVWVGTHWERDTSGMVMRMAQTTIKRLARQIETLSDAQAKALLAHIKSSLSTAKLKAMIEQAQAAEGMAVQPDALDTDIWLLNCTNGALNLKTGKLHPHRREDLMTKCLTIAYEEEAVCPLWDAFLWRIMGGSQEPDDPDMSLGELASRQKADDRATALISYLRRAAGYTLTGSTQEQCIFLCHGVTKTGKSTYLATIRALLGPYGKQTDIQTFLHKDRPEVRNDLADLAGARYVYAVETQEGKRLAEGLVKQMTGGVDHMKARFLFEEYFEFPPQFKAYIGTNHLPVIKDSDDAIWERIRKVPFEVQIPKAERNKRLEDDLIKELPGILAWAVRGCLDWLARNDLVEPEAVVAATEDYRFEMDDVGQFLDEVCQTGASHYQTKASVLLAAYHQWAGHTTMTGKALTKRLEKKGYHSERKTAGYFWQGIGLPSTATTNRSNSPMKDE